MSVKLLRRLQIGVESTDAPGTAVAATTLLRMTGTIQDTRETVFAEEDVGYLSGVDRTYVPKVGAELEVEGEATFEQLPYILKAGVDHAAATTDTGTGYIWTFNFPTTAAKNLNTYTIEGGDDQACEKTSYAFVTEFALSGEAGAAWKMSASWVGRAINDTDSFTDSASVTLSTVEEMLFSKTKLFIDNATASTDMGLTQKSNTLIGAELNVTTGWGPVFTGEGNLYFSFIKCAEPEILLKITFEHDGSATAEKTAWRAQTARQIRLQCLGSALTTAGAYTYKTVNIDLVGKWETFDAIEDKDGNDIVTGTFRARYNSTTTTFASITVVNNLATMP